MFPLVLNLVLRPPPDTGTALQHIADGRQTGLRDVRLVDHDERCRLVQRILVNARARDDHRLSEWRLLGGYPRVLLTPTLQRRNSKKHGSATREGNIRLMCNLH